MSFGHDDMFLCRMEMVWLALLSQFNCFTTIIRHFGTALVYVSMHIKSNASGGVFHSSCTFKDYTRQ